MSSRGPSLDVGKTKGRRRDVLPMTSGKEVLQDIKRKEARTWHRRRASTAMSSFFTNHFLYTLKMSLSKDKKRHPPISGCPMYKVSMYNGRCTQRPYIIANDLGLYNICVNLLYLCHQWPIVVKRFNVQPYFSTTQCSMFRVALVMLAPIFITLRPSAVNGSA